MFSLLIKNVTKHNKPLWWRERETERQRDRETDRDRQRQTLSNRIFTCHGASEFKRQQNKNTTNVNFTILINKFK